MSAETKKAMEAAIEAHLADEHEDQTTILSGYLLEAAGQTAASERGVVIFNIQDGQSGITTRGLQSYLNASVDAYYPHFEAPE